MIRLDIRHLEVLAAVQQFPSLTLAAQHLGVTQSALSHRIREAERRLDAILCARHNRALRLTLLGERLVAGAKPLLRELEELERQVEFARSGITEILRIGSRAYGCYRWLPEFLKHFRALEPTIGVELVDDAATRPFEALERGLVDLSIQSGTGTSRAVARVPLFRDELVAILPPEHPKAARPYLRPGDFEGETYVTYSTSAERGHEWDLLFGKHGIRIERFLTAGLTEAVLELVHSGFGISIVAGWAASSHAASGRVVTRKVTARGLSVDWFAAYRRGSGCEAPAARLANALAKWCRDNSSTIGYRPEK